MGVEPSSVCASLSLCVCASVNTFNIYISATDRLNSTKFYLKHYWGRGEAALGFGPGRNRTLVFMITNSSHRVVMGKML